MGAGLPGGSWVQSPCWPLELLTASGPGPRPIAGQGWRTPESVLTAPSCAGAPSHSALVSDTRVEREARATRPGHPVQTKPPGPPEGELRQPAPCTPLLLAGGWEVWTRCPGGQADPPAPVGGRASSSPLRGLHVDSPRGMVCRGDGSHCRAGPGLCVRWAPQSARVPRVPSP